MIKRILRKRLRRDIATYIGAKNPEYEDVFNWVYNAPIWNWNVMKTCVIQGNSLREAKRLYALFCK